MTLDPLRVSNILCPTDFSIFSTRAFRHALALAHQFKASVQVVHILPLIPNVAGSPYLPTPVFPSPEQRKAAKAEMLRFVEPAAGSGVDVTTAICDGQPWREIQALARDLPADLVALGTHGRSGFERFVLGSVTERLLGRLPCPVLTVCHEEGRTWEAPGLLKRILCATDFSPAAAGAVTLAVSLAEKTRSEITLLHVIDALPTADDPFSYAVPETAALRKALQEQAWPRLHAAIPDVLPSGIKVYKSLMTGRAHEKILEVAAERRADLVVLGTRGHGPLDRLLFGSTSARVVREATCPVIAVPDSRAALVDRKTAHSAAPVAVAR